MLEALKSMAPEKSIHAEIIKLPEVRNALTSGQRFVKVMINIKFNHKLNSMHFVTKTKNIYIY